MDKLAKKNVGKVIDLLSERLAFERAAVSSTTPCTRGCASPPTRRSERCSSR